MNLLKSTLEKALIVGGTILKRGFSRPKHIQYKGPVSLVTETDKEAERAILQVIQKRFPNHSILAEESGASLGSRQKWIIDPLDGTTNFAHGLPLVCVSIAYEENGIVRLGGVWNPILDEWFWAEQGKGASLNGKKIRISKIKSLKTSLLVTGFPYDRLTRPRYYTRFFEVFMNRTHGVRRLGSAAIDLCYVASGRFDGFWEFGLKAWDVAAGGLIAKEAGACLTDFKGKPMNIYGEQTLVANSYIHGSMLRLIKRLF